jgi:hypothetical protein
VKQFVFELNVIAVAFRRPGQGIVFESWFQLRQPGGIPAGNGPL